MKRMIALCLASAMACALCACGAGGEEELLSRASGLDPDAAALTVDGREVPAWRYLYFLAHTCDYLSACYGGDIRWEDTAEGLPLGDYAKARAQEAAALYATVENWAETYGCALTPEDRSAMEREWAARSALYGGEAAYLAELSGLGLDRERAESLSADLYLYRRLYALYSTQDSPLAPPEEELTAFARERGYRTVDHIWISTAAADPGDESATDVCRARAEEAFAKLNASPDPLHDFAVLAQTYSDEKDRGQHPEGYTCVLGDGTLPAACEEALADLEEGQFSGVVEAEDGFYLLLCRPLETQAVAPDYFDALLQAAAESAEVSVSRACAELDVAGFYEKLLRGREELSARDGAA